MDLNSSQDWASLKYTSRSQKRTYTIPSSNSPFGITHGKVLNQSEAFCGVQFLSQSIGIYLQNCLIRISPHLPDWTDVTDSIFNGNTYCNRENCVHGSFSFNYPGQKLINAQWTLSLQSKLKVTRGSPKGNQMLWWCDQRQHMPL